MRTLNKEQTERAVLEWLKSYRRPEYLRLEASGELSRVVQERAQQIEDQWQEESGLIWDEATRKKNWGTEEGQREFQMSLDRSYQAILERLMPMHEVEGHPLEL